MNQGGISHRIKHLGATQPQWPHSTIRSSHDGYYREEQPLIQGKAFEGSKIKQLDVCFQPIPLKDNNFFSSQMRVS